MSSAHNSTSTADLRALPAGLVAAIDERLFGGDMAFLMNLVGWELTPSRTMLINAAQSAVVRLVSYVASGSAPGNR